MNILITGGAGFIGSNLALALQEKGGDIVIVDNFSSGSFRNLRDFKGDLIASDLVNLDLFSRLGNQSFDIIFHQASITDTTLRNQRRMIYTNVEGFRNVLNFALNINAKLIYASSAGVYGNSPVPMKESQKLSPLNCYAFSKCIIDNIAEKVIRGGNITIIGLRYFNVYGSREKHKGKAASMIYQLAQQMRKGRRPRIFKYGEQARDFIYIKDVVKANIKAIEAKESGIVNIGTGVATTFNRVIEILSQVLNISVETEYFDNPYSSYQNKTEADTTLARRLLGFEAEFGIEPGINDYLYSLK